MRYIDEAPWGPTLRYTSIRAPFFPSPNANGIILFPIPERSVMRPQLNDIYCPPKPCYMAFWSRIGLPQVDSLVVTCLSRQSAHGAPYVIDGPGGGPNERPTVTFIRKRFPCLSSGILQRTFPGPVNSLSHTSRCHSFSCSAPRGSLLVWHNYHTVRSLRRALSPPTWW